MLDKQPTIQPVAEVGGGGVWGSFNSVLSGALDNWGKIQQIQGQKSASGQDQLQAKLQPELPNASAVQIDHTPVEKTDSDKMFNNPLLIGSFGLLAVALLLRAAK